MPRCAGEPVHKLEWARIREQASANVSCIWRDRQYLRLLRPPTVSIATIRLCCCNTKAATEDPGRSVQGCAPVELYLQKQAAGHSLPTSSGGGKNWEDRLAPSAPGWAALIWFPASRRISKPVIFIALECPVWKRAHFVFRCRPSHHKYLPRKWSCFLGRVLKVAPLSFALQCLENLHVGTLCQLGWDEIAVYYWSDDTNKDGPHCQGQATECGQGGICLSPHYCLTDP